jgi:hypothetical protein
MFVPGWPPRTHRDTTGDGFAGDVVCLEMWVTQTRDIEP